MLVIGCHLSISGGLLSMGEEATRLGGNTFQFFPRNPRGGRPSLWSEEDVEKLRNWMDAHSFGEIMCHGAYTMNGASADPKVREFAEMAIREDLARIARLPRCLYNFHPGSHVKQGAEVGIQLISDMLNRAMDQEELPMVLLETMAGKGSEVGRTFEELAAIMENMERKDKIGICLDTCHVYDGGYDIKEDLDGVLARFDEIIGLEHLHAIHLNDSKNPMGSHKDRHECLGQGSLGFEALENILNHPKLRTLPFYLETPNDSAGYAKEIAWCKSVYKE